MHHILVPLIVAVLLRLIFHKKSKGFIVTIIALVMASISIVITLITHNDTFGPVNLWFISASVGSIIIEIILKIKNR